MRKLLTIAALVALAGCESPTQITVVVTADPTVCTAQLDTEVSVGSLAEVSSGRPPATTTTGCTNGQVGSVVLIPSGGEGSEVAFRVLASVDGTTDCATTFGPGCIEATRALRYLPHTELTVDVPLRVSCEGVVCADPTTTCVSGACVSATIDPTQCEGTGCGEGALGPSSPALDAGSDATLGDAAIDATILDAATDTGADTGVSTDADDDATSDAEIDADATAPIDASLPTIALALGFEASCALLLDGAIQCWGGNQYGELGIGDAGGDGGLPPTQVAGLPASMVSIAGGEAAGHVCAFASDGGMFCWGANAYGQLGVSTGANTSSDVPLAVVGAPVVSALSLGAYQTCGPTDSASAVTCWGDWGGNLAGLGAIVPGAVVPVFSVASGAQVGCEASGEAGVYCWGFDEGFVTPDSGSGDMQQAPETAGAVEVAIGYGSVCARGAAGAVFCWGTNDSGELGFPSDGGTFGPTAIALPDGRAAVHIAVGGWHICALLDDATAACWGRNDANQCGSAGIGTEVDTPVRVPGVTGATALVAGMNHTCAVLGGTSVVCWGDDTTGQLGAPGDPTGVPQPVTFAK